ncbi:hypothetical protein [Clostridium perfringens]|uniref:hypothetical protein n=1 Tax=Clostridium perfringens TaxID=1502 RepID=UPI001A2A7F0C|nr:hypothetical protein [Clostridium perfringens]MDK0610404.1 hypothetical protein [Clostridium perfringens]MDM0758143.1 hypothetical protein [Clostridium perfringens]MDM0760074.1 hypothetical protein [Clostridium perfringens]MDM0995538.1 hypothetical protein [Clostridium perfringens]MDZ4948897.1 hypothetical protein [Clostridium perfringens]
MWLRNITIENANKIKDILLNDGLKDEISLRFDFFNMEINITNLSESEYDENNDAWISFLDDNKENNNLCMKIKDKYYNLYMFFGDWGYKYYIPNMHISLYSNFSKFGNHFAQIDFSQAIEDDNNIYIVKKISKLTGAGAIARLNNNLGSDKNAKFGRRHLLVNKLNAEVINYEKEKWMCLSKIKKSDLNNSDMREDILYKLLYDFIKYAFTVEEIISENIVK